MSNDISPSRREALRQLERVEQDRAFASLVDQEEELDRQSQRQVREYVAGVTRWKRWLDYLLETFYHGDYAEVDDRLRHILRLGTYELLFMHTPTHAAIYENVELAKRMVHRGVTGLVNGVLRTVDRQRDNLRPPNTGDRADDLGVQYSHPTWMVRRWLDRLGESETIELLEWNNRRPMYAVRANTQKASVEDFHEHLDELGAVWTESPFLDDFVRMKRLQAVVKSGWLEEGRCAVQDESAGLIVRLLDPQPGETVLDACAAPGGKAMYAAQRMNGEGTILAIDANTNRLGLVDEAAEAQGFAEMVQTTAAELQDVADQPDPPRADRVLLDAPCSGLGVLSKRADMRWQRTPEDLDELTALQAELLDAAATLVKPSGLLVYATCTIEPEENQERVQAFLNQHDAFSVESAEAFVPDECVTDEGYFASLPHWHGIDGAFGVRLRRAE